ncbi:uncharacterized protein LOC122072189 isoform X2 [Macadamia integrifolia]|uniref:uncharacterized protein LOC122072189 isoform X2 n=1 Tax=Macadamia integrifolia TaxID=60698 RepID=UPI001C4F602E|nr:uncharacterized protein LOC122072189 isoform X2 [Macadamia integrifolia]
MMVMEKDMEAPLDFELEDPILSPPAPTKRRGRDVGLDDLLKDFFKEKKKRDEREFKRARSRKCYNSDEDEETAHLSKLVNQCEQKIQEIGDEDEVPLWGLHVFGNQKTPPLPVGCLELRSCKLFQSKLNSELNLLLGLTAEKGDAFFEGLLINGWLPKLVFRCGHVEEHLAVWTFNLMLYSSKEELRAPGCDFWCAILPSRDEAEQPSLQIDWFPSSVNLKQALEIYGYLLDSSFVISSLPEVVHADSDCRGPPQNIRFWIKFLTACCGVRGTWSIFSTSEAEEFLGVIISLFLDRQLQGLCSILSECMVAIIGYFEDQEWNISCAEVAKSLASRIFTPGRRLVEGVKRMDCITSTVVVLPLLLPLLLLGMSLNSNGTVV